MAVPQRRTSKTRKRLRRTHFKLSVKGLVTCPHCGEMIKSHHVCPHCGYYNGKPIVVKKTKAAQNEENTSKKESKKTEKKEEVKENKKAEKKAEKKTEKKEDKKESK